MAKTSIEFTAKSNVNSDLRLDIALDNQPICTMTLSAVPQVFRHEFSDIPASHRLEIQLSNKKSHQTKINEHNEIIEDVFAEIFDIRLSDIDLGHVFYGQSLYFHDHNGATRPVIGQFFRQLGCNGLVRFEFCTPAYLWLYDNV